MIIRNYHGSLQSKIVARMISHSRTKPNTTCESKAKDLGLKAKANNLFHWPQGSPYEVCVDCGDIWYVIGYCLSVVCSLCWNTTGSDIYVKCPTVQWLSAHCIQVTVCLSICLSVFQVIVVCAFCLLFFITLWFEHKALENSRLYRFDWDLPKTSCLRRTRCLKCSLEQSAMSQTLCLRQILDKYV